MKVLLISIDTLRSDHVGCYGYNGTKTRTTPFLDSLAESSVVFERHYAAEVPTPPSYTSLFHGRRAIKNGIYTFGHYGKEFACPMPSLAQRFYLQGYRTGAISNLCWVYPWLHAGFMDIYKPGNRFQGGDAEEVTREALRWLRDFGRGDFFLFVHYWDPHVPYRRRSKEAYRPLFSPEEYRDRAPEMKYFENDPELDRAYREKHDHLGDPQDPAENLALYDANIRYADDQIAALFEGMKPLGVDPDELVVAITSDHGEAFGEYGFWDHYSGYRNIAQVPYIMRGPGMRAGRVGSYTQHVDVLPTLCELAGMEAGDKLCGKSMAGLLKESRESLRDYAVVETAFGAVQRMLVRDEFALVHTMFSLGRTHIKPFELFDLRTDPDQLHDISAREKKRTDRMRIELEDWVIQNGGGAFDKLRFMAAKKTMGDMSFLVRK
ncbi:MAG: sulfatase [Candidatus Sumerlaeota bacterium]|nr:sulfatase [Candidatus Sumerlaeota bacterium]